MEETLKARQAEQEEAALRRQIDAAAGRERADLVLKGAAYVNVFSNRLCRGDIAISGDKIVGIGTYDGENEIDLSGRIVCPGLIDAHIHLESSMVSPSAFAQAVLPHGTTAVVTDPHEIANVMGTDGIAYMLQATQGLPIDVWFLLPSCVPATPMDESGAQLSAEMLEPLYRQPRVLGLAEVMDYVSVAHADESMLKKLAGARHRNLHIDGHAPGLSGKELDAYITAGIQSDHECSTLEEATEKLEHGQWIMIREGTAARNLAALAPLLRSPLRERCMLCSDDKHPNDLLKRGHMDDIARTAIRCHGVDPIIAVKTASFQAAQYFSLKGRGAVAPGYFADITVIDSFEQFQPKMVIKDGVIRWREGEVPEPSAPHIDKQLSARAHDTFHTAHLRAEQFSSSESLGVIGLVPGDIRSTDCGRANQIDLKRDILKISVIERHRGTGHIGLGYLHGYGLSRGAVATSVAHDSHNLIVVGTNDADMAAAANHVIAQGGGIAVLEQGRVLAQVTLELAGLMSNRSLSEVNQELEQCKSVAYRLGVNQGIDPFMTLSFMSLPVIPTLRITTKGVLDTVTQRYLNACSSDPH